MVPTKTCPYHAQAGECHADAEPEATGLQRWDSWQPAAIDSQAIGYSDDIELDDVPAAADMRRFDALVNVAADCLSV
jgi:hypothetical protein